jgi:hypothetical protein
MRYDDRKDIGGEIAGKVIRRIAKLFNDEGFELVGIRTF